MAETIIYFIYFGADSTGIQAIRSKVVSKYTVPVLDISAVDILRLNTTTSELIVYGYDRIIDDFNLTSARELITVVRMRQIRERVRIQ